MEKEKQLQKYTGGGGGETANRKEKKRKRKKRKERKRKERKKKRNEKKGGKKKDYRPPCVVTFR